MAKSRRKVRRTAKRPKIKPTRKERTAKRRVAKRKAVARRKKIAKAKARRPVRKKTRAAKPRGPRSIIDRMAETVRDTGNLRRQLAGPNTFED